MNLILSHIGSAKFIAAPFALAAAVLMLSTSSARADDFTFSFGNTTGLGDVSGTVTGEIFGLTNNSTSSATEVLITGWPAGLDSVLGSGPINASLWDQQIADSFTEVGGVVTAASFSAADTIAADTVGAQLFLNYDLGYASDTNFLNIDGDDELFVWNNNGLDGLTFAPSSVTPEPSSLILLATGLAGAVGACRRRRLA